MPLSRLPSALCGGMQKARLRKMFIEFCDDVLRLIACRYFATHGMRHPLIPFKHWPGRVPCVGECTCKSDKLDWPSVNRQLCIFGDRQVGAAAPLAPPLDLPPSPPPPPAARRRRRRPASPARDARSLPRRVRLATGSTS